MSHSTVRDAFRSRLAAVLPGVWDFVETVNSTNRNDAADKWVTLEVIGGAEQVVGIGGAGNNRHLETGVVLIQLYAVAGAGHADVEGACDTIRAGFRQYRSGYLKVNGCDPPITMEDPPWFRAQIAVPYEFDTYG